MIFTRVPFFRFSGEIFFGVIFTGVIFTGVIFTMDLFTEHRVDGSRGHNDCGHLYFVPITAELHAIKTYNDDDDDVLRLH